MFLVRQSLWIGVAGLLVGPLPICSAQQDLATEVKQILRKHCHECHGGKRKAAKLDVLDRDGLIDRKVLVPGKPKDSELLQRVLAKDDGIMPPPERPRL